MPFLTRRHFLNSSIGIAAAMSARTLLADDQSEAKGEAGWGNQIRSYVLQPYQLVKDLRTGVTSTSPFDVLDGDRDRFMAAYDRPPPPLDLQRVRYLNKQRRILAAIADRKAGRNDKA